jgi:hypothetical protein
MTRATCEQCGLPFTSRQKLWSHLGPRQYWGVRPCETILRIRAGCLPDAPASPGSASPLSPLSSASGVSAGSAGSALSDSSASSSSSRRSAASVCMSPRATPATAEVAAHMIWSQLAARHSLDRGKLYL